MADKGKYIKKKNPGGGLNEKWLEIYRPNQSQRNKDFWKLKGQIIHTGTPRNCTTAEDL